MNPVRAEEKGGLSGPLGLIVGTPLGVWNALAGPGSDIGNPGRKNTRSYLIPFIHLVK